jgi:ABC-2 type transport system permease protein
MKMQTKASFRKETLAFLRTNKFLTLAIVLIGISILYPLLMIGMGPLLDSMSPMYDELGMDVSGMPEMLISSASVGVSSGVTSLASIGLLVYLLLMNSFAGGEQKKRSVIIPRSAGLRSFGYIFPKFIIYPLAALALAIIGAFAAWGTSVWLYETNDVSLLGVLVSGVLAGIFMMFFICCHLTLGTSTGKAGMSSAICIVASVLLPDIFVIMGFEYVYNPFTLTYLAGAVVVDGALGAFETLDIVITALITLAIMVALYFIALFAQNARKIDNTGNEIRL